MRSALRGKMERMASTNPYLVANIAPNAVAYNANRYPRPI